MTLATLLRCKVLVNPTAGVRKKENATTLPGTDTLASAIEFNGVRHLDRPKR